MTVKFVFEKKPLEAWILCHQMCNMLERCEEATFSKSGLTPQQYWVLAAIKFNTAPVNHRDVANWLGRNTNSITLIVDRMENKGLVKRFRDLPDRRSVRLVMTPKAEEVFTQVVEPYWDLISKMMSCLSEEETQTYIGLLEQVNERAFEHSYPGAVMEEAKTKDIERTVRELSKGNGIKA